ncbi:patatin-like phospholipase family protein [Thermopolyspora sp. NPDC052614]|uniref:patatin-like phospholipase family protein n=1 Tax=Thermopolyspora sp. NPDC052614 TaxID=3155682 RepID=UPI0034245EE1
MSKALVLAGGGIAGISWEVGMIHGLIREGVDLTDADRIVGTSAGSVVGALVTGGADLEQAIEAQIAAETGSARSPEPTPDADLLAAFAILFDPTIDPKEGRRRIGEMALAAETAPEDHTARVFERLPIQGWPDRDLRITAVDAYTGDFVVWDRDSGVPLVKAVTASCAVPGVFPPVTVGDRRYIDGGVRSPVNADLAAGASSVVVLEPLSALWPRERVQAEIDTLGDAKVLSLTPDEAALAVFGANVLDPALWGPAFKAGLDQAASAADAVRKVWKPAED